ncbi:MAG: HTH domain-containing protein [Candidatus Hodarchaeota archaeon]
MPLCPKCGEYYLKVCPACGYSVADALDQIVSEASTTHASKPDKSDLTVSLERRRIYDLLSRTSEKFTIRQIAVEAQVSQSTVRKALTELSDEGYVLSEESASGAVLYGLTEAGHSRFRYSSETLEGWTPSREILNLYNVLTTIIDPVTIKDLCERSGASEYLVRKTIKLLEQHREAICEDRAARPRKYMIKPGPYVESLLEP